MTGTATVAPTIGDLYRGFFRAGASGFGGTLFWAHRMLVEQRRWLTAEEFTEIFSLCQFLPGPNVINMSIAVGSRFNGLRGALTAFAGLMTVPVTSITTLAILYRHFGQTPGIDGVLRGVGAAAAGLVAAMGLQLAAPLVRSRRAIVFMVAAFAGIALLRWPLVPVLLVLAPVSVLAARATRA
ncbi:MAG: chromate transporter [Candidatus Rokubacteria bacterium]|nr:chromate transporter [Candidatus Rokubacteria bacterium]